MGQVISATTRFGGKGSASDRFLASARSLLVDADRDAQAGKWDLALENAYRAALRVAGARIASSAAVAKRRRLPTSAWDRLALVDAAGAGRARDFAAYSGLRQRVASGIIVDPDEATVRRVLDLAREFLAEVEAESGWGAVA